MKHIDLETKLGGFFGGTAVVAIIGEMYLSGFSVPGLMAGLKDISGTLVSVLDKYPYRNQKNQTRYQRPRNIFEPSH
jgi:hypothetical protein